MAKIQQLEYICSDFKRYLKDITANKVVSILKNHCPNVDQFEMIYDLFGALKDIYLYNSEYLDARCSLKDLDFKAFEKIQDFVDYKSDYFGQFIINEWYPFRFNMEELSLDNIKEELLKAIGIINE